MNKSVIAIVAGVVLGIVGARYLFVGSWMILLPWSLAGIALGWWGTKNEAIVNGVSYGFILSIIFLIAGYSGRFSLFSRIPFFIVFGAFGAMCGMILGLAGFYSRAQIKRRSEKA